MDSTEERGRHPLPPWEYRQLVSVPFRSADAQDDTSHRRQDSKTSLPELKTDMPVQQSRRLLSFWKRSDSTDQTLAPHHFNAPYETTLEGMPSRQDSFSPLSASTATTITPINMRTTGILPGTMSSRTREAKHRKKKSKPQAPSVHEVAKPDSIGRTLKGLFRSHSTTRQSAACERLRQGHWAEDEY